MAQTGKQPAPGQLSFDFDSRRRLLRQLQIGDGQVKHLLRVLNDRIGDRADCFLKIVTIAAEMNVSERTVRRAVSKAVSLELIIVLPDRQGRRCRRYRIRWAEIRDRVSNGDNLTAQTGHSVTPDRTNCPTKAANLSGLKKTPRRDPPKGNLKTEPFDPMTVDLKPYPALDTPGFLQAWLEWCEYRRLKRQRISLPACTKQLKLLAAAGEQEAIRAIERSIANDWQGIFPDKNKGGRSGDLSAFQRFVDCDES